MLISQLSKYKQWVIHHTDKVPLRVWDGLKASPTNAADWCDFATAQAFVQQYPQYGLGFVLTSNDPFTVIDLDTYKIDQNENLTPEQRASIKSNHAEIFKAFDTYTELSPSGGGVHIWCVGKVDSRKFDAQYLEVYSTERYMTVTFKPVNTNSVEDRQVLLNDLIASIDAAQPRHINTGSSVNLPQTLTDDDVCQRAANAENGELFKQLYRGEWQGLYPSQSEADLTFCNIVAFYTDNQEQVGRIYWSSPLFLNSPKRKRKLKRNYLFDEKYGLVKKAFDQKIPQPDFKGIAETWDKVKILEALPDVEDIFEYVPDKMAPAAEQWQRPVGLLGDISEYIYQSAVLPNIEVALAGAITFMAGICGRSFNTITGTGLNQYVVLLAQTGQGKEAAARGISRLFKAVQRQVPAISSYAGPSEIASAQALLKYFAESNCFWSHKNEFGFWLQKMNSKYAKPNELTLKGMLLDLFHKSGHEDLLMGSIYSDKKNNAPLVKAPSLTLYGESTPEEFYKAVDEANITEGLISRLTLIPVPDVRPPYNAEAGQYAPPDGLVWRISGLVKRVEELSQTQTAHRVAETPEAAEYQLVYQKLCMDRVWANREEVTAKIWQRAHIRLLRLGALIAVGVNPDNPLVERSHYEWAKKIIDYGAMALKKRFESGEVGEENFQLEQRRDLKKFLKKYGTMNFSDSMAKSYRITFDMWKAKAIPYAAIYQRVQGYASFRKDRNISTALYNVIREFESAGYLIKVDAATAKSWGKSGNVWCVTGDIGE